jgi:hypothetical protein
MQLKITVLNEMREAVTKVGVCGEGGRETMPDENKGLTGLAFSHCFTRRTNSKYTRACLVAEAK